MKLVEFMRSWENSSVKLNPMNIISIEIGTDYATTIRMVGNDEYSVRGKIEDIEKQINEALNYTPQFKYEADSSDILNPLSKYIENSRNNLKVGE
jgi:hypothetical protein